MFGTGAGGRNEEGQRSEFANVLCAAGSCLSPPLPPSPQTGCSVVKTYCGHGIGHLFHTGPNVPHYAKNKAKGVMRKGHVFTVEPMINVGTWEDVTWGDNWTAVTRDGKRSAQFEHTVVVTDTGVEILTARDDEPRMVWDTEKNTRH